MSFWRTILGLLRKPSIGIPTAVAALLLGGAAFAVAPTRYISTETLVLTTPASGGTVSQDPNRPNGLTNPLLNFDNGLRVTSGILIQAVNTPEILEALGLGTTRVAIDDGRTNPNLIDNNGPFVYVVADSPTANEALATIDRVVKRLREDLVARQIALKAPEVTYITLVPVVEASTPAASMAGKVKMAGLGFLAPLVFGLGLGYLLVRRSRGRHAADKAIPAEINVDGGQVADSGSAREVTNILLGASSASRLGDHQSNDLGLGVQHRPVAPAEAAIDDLSVDDGGDPDSLIASAAAESVSR